MNHISRIKYFFLTVFFLTTCYLLLTTIFPSPIHASDPADPPIFDCTAGFTTLGFDGITYKKFNADTPGGRQLQWHVVKVDLISNPNAWDFMVTPRANLGTTTGAFATEFGTVVAINGDFHYANTWTTLGLAAAITEEEGGGLFTDVYGEDSLEPSVYFSYENEIQFFGNNPFGELYDAISGSHDMVKNKKVNELFENCSWEHPEYCYTHRARTGMGLIEANGEPETLVIIVVDEPAGISEGVALNEFAEMFMQCNVNSALNMDGGGSSTLIGPNGILNNTTGGTQRIVANHFGICKESCIPPDPVNLPPALPGGDPRPRYEVGNEYPFPCDKVAPQNSANLFNPLRGGDPEFHSLRPYQASPCNPNYSDLALFCGDNITIGDIAGVIKEFTNLPSNDADFTFNGNNVPPQPPAYGSNPCRFCDNNQQCVANPPPCIPDYDQCSPGGGECENGCEMSADGKTEKCSFIVSNTRDIVVNLTGASYPIMGYTEPSVDNDTSGNPHVVNSQFPDATAENLDNKSKVNEYVSWYLNGVQFRAEYPYPDATKTCVGQTTGLAGICYREKEFNPPPDACKELSPNLQKDSGTISCSGSAFGFGYNDICCVDPSGIYETTDTYNLVNLSGPLNKLLPQRIQFESKENQITQGFETKGAGTNMRHNQTAACVYDFNPFGGVLLGIPAPCYENLLFDLFKGEVRLSHWRENTADAEPPDEEDYPNSTEYLLALKDWRGQWCIPIGPFPLPVIGDWTFYFCIDALDSSDYWAELFPYIPYASTEDRLGKVDIKSSSFQVPSPNFRIVTMTIHSSPAKLFVPHMEEAAGTAEILQKTYAPGGVDLNNITDSGSIPYSPYCEFKEVRTNPGDDLFPGQLTATLNYTAQVTCEFDVAGNGNICEKFGDENGFPDATCFPSGPNTACQTDLGGMDCGGGNVCGVGCTDFGQSLTFDPNPGGACDANFGPGAKCVLHQLISSDSWNCSGGYSNNPNLEDCGADYGCGFGCSQNTDELPTSQSCDNIVYVTLKTETSTPLADKVWTKLVAGSAGVFRRMFPQLGPTGVFGGLYDMPAGTNVKISSNADETFAGDPNNQKSGSNAQIYFPHIGGIKEYFLTGIQTLLRPLGFGNKIVTCPIDDPTCLGDGTFNIPNPPGDGSNTCDLECEENPTPYSSADLFGPIKDKFQELGTNWFGTGIGSPRMEKYDQVINASLAAGVDPVFTLAIWLHESAGSNYLGLCQYFGGDPSAPGCQKIQDFGINQAQYETQIQAPGVLVPGGDHFDDQLNHFLPLPNWYIQYCDPNAAGCAWETFEAMFTSNGSCTPNPEDTDSYIASIKVIYGWLTSHPFPCYATNIQ